MPIEREVLLKRIEYLRDVQKFLESGLKESLAIAIASPIINIFARFPQLFLAIVIGDAILALILSIQILKLRNRIESLWEEVMRDPERWTKPWWLIGVAAIFVASIVAILLTW